MANKKGKTPLGMTILATFFFLFPGSWANAERLKVATATRLTAAYFLPVLAAQEQGFFKEEGLQTEWVPFAGGTPMTHAFAARSVALALDVATSVIIISSRGIPVRILADLGQGLTWFLYVRNDSPIRSPGDLRGARFGAVRFGSLADGFTKAMAKQLGIGKEIRLIALGAVPERMAALRTGAIDATFSTVESMAGLEEQGFVRRLLALSDYVPFRRDPVTIFATDRLIQENPREVEKSVRALLKATEFVMKERDWSVGLIKRERNWPDGVARRVYESLMLSSSGRIDPGLLGKISEFLIEYGLVVKEKTPPVSALYTERFLPKN